MPKAMPQTLSRRSGLGRGLASLIPSGDNKPSLGDGAANVILGAGSSNGSQAQRTAGQRRADVNSEGRSAQGQSGTSRGDGGANGPRTTAGSLDEDGSAAHSPTPDQTTPSASRKGEGKYRHRDVTQGGIGQADSLEQKDHNGVEATAAEAGQTNNFGAEYRELPIGAIRTNAKQPRQVFDEEALNELVHSIREFGLMQPIVVRHSPHGDSEFELIMGERRLRASKKAGLQSIPAIVRETEDNAMLRDALLENIHRVQLNPLEEAAAYQQLLEEFGVTQAQLAQKLGRSRPLITNMIRLLQLPVAVQRRVGAGVLSAGHARALLGVRAPSEIADDEATHYVHRAQGQIADRIVAEALSVRATEEAVTLLNRGEGARKKPKTGPSKELAPEVSSWVEDISDALDTKVSVQMGKKRGKIVVEFGGPEDFDRITDLLKYRG
ncbi:ParB/RepB/Spo0J family partition protein [Corynebacterium auriscanis]|uniref:ParB/RepB/Spo0J family partition protein n=1 Tax=Corynebacterium auriscanis TaxID=99807 RepID=UPI00224729DD|nr:ParB/RepB/Spo0J family partition protein [Corynebacterium auriscanis]MCX2163634.1 ParB/RepB/Spo0J family partition protein [Corynebacterium auriscanis]